MQEYRERRKALGGKPLRKPQKPKRPPKVKHRVKESTPTTRLVFGDDFDYHGAVLFRANCTCGWSSQPVPVGVVQDAWAVHYMESQRGS